MKEEVSIQEILDVDPAGSEQFDTETAEAFDTLNSLMQASYFSVFTTPFDEFIEDYESQTGEASEVQVNLDITDPSYNTRRVQKKKNSEH